MNTANTGPTNTDGGSIHALTGAYVVDALDDLEHRRFEQHLAGCADCRAEVDSLRAAADRLSEITAVPPPPGLRDRLLSDIKTVRPLPPLVSGDSTDAADTDGADAATGAEDRSAEAEAEAEAEAGAEAAQPRHARRRSPLRLLAAAAAVIGVVGVGTAVVQPWDDGQAPGTSQGRLTAADRVLAASDAQRISTELPSGARATVVRSVSQGKAVLVTRGMRPAPNGKVYELWLQAPSGTMLPAGLMSSAGDRTVVLDGNAAQAKAAGITVEPSGGSSEPTSAPIALFDFHTGRATT